MGLHPELMIQRRRLETRALAVQEVRDPRTGICEYADGCDGAKDRETFTRYCENDGEYCPSKFQKAMGESK